MEVADEETKRMYALRKAAGKDVTTYINRYSNLEEKKPEPTPEVEEPKAVEPEAVEPQVKKVGKKPKRRY